MKLYSIDHERIKLGLDGREVSVNVRHNLVEAFVTENFGEELDMERAIELVDELALVTRFPLKGC